MPPLAPPIWPVEASDHEAIAAIVEAAFGQPDETRLVERLREAEAVFGEWIATIDQTPVGHIMMSRATLVGDPETGVAALAPIAVHPTHQGKGIGSALIRHALSELAVSACDLVFVLGDPAYYRRFGFDSDFGRAFDTPWREAGDANMVMAVSAEGAMIYGGALEFAEPLTHMTF